MTLITTSPLPVEDRKILNTLIPAMEQVERELEKKRYAEIEVEKVEDGGIQLRVPMKAFRLFTEILKLMSSGSAIAITPVQGEISTQVAADLLNVSRPYIVKLIDEGILPARKIGKHRRININDLDDYHEIMTANTRIAMRELRKLGQKIEKGEKEK